MADTDVLRRASAFRYDGTKIVSRNPADLDMEGEQILNGDINASPIGGTTPAAGNFTDVEISGEVQADVDMGGNHLLNCQTVQDLAAKGAGYWFDGVDDRIYVADNNNLEIRTGDFSFVASFRLGDGSIMGKRSQGTNTYDGYSIGGTLTQIVVSLGLDGVTDDLIIGATLGMRYVAIGTVDRDGLLTAYINGISKDTADISAKASFDSNTSEPFTIGYRHRSSLSDRYYDEEIYGTLLFNLALTAAEVKALSSGAPIPYKYLGASQTEMITDSDNQDFADGTINEWVVYNVGGGNGTLVYDAGPGGVKTGKVTVGAVTSTATSAALPTSQFTTLIPGKQYHIEADVYIPSTNNNFTALEVTTQGMTGVANMGSVTANVGIEDAWQTVTFDFIPVNDITGNIRILGSSTTTGDIFYIDNISIKQVGCVAQYEQPGIGHNQWLDNSGNELHGAVSGAIPTNLPAGHIEQYPVTVTADELLTDVIPAKYILERVICEETAGNAAVICLGTTNGGSEVFLDETIAASDITVIEVNKIFSSTLAQTLDINDDSAGSDFNSASIDVTLMMRRVA